ncbi:hypothetical protein BH23CHL4_BH23CHL4_13700 [soil metagenome]
MYLILFSEALYTDLFSAEKRVSNDLAIGSIVAGSVNDLPVRVVTPGRVPRMFIPLFLYSLIESPMFGILAQVRGYRKRLLPVSQSRSS